MDSVLVRGGRPLNGSVQLSGSKNAATKCIIASLLTNKRCVFFNVPDVWDVTQTLAMCHEIGMEYVFDKQAKILEVHTPNLKTTHIPQRFSGSNRVPILMLGALLSRAEEEITIPYLCGEDTSPLDYHVEALRSLGATIEQKNSGKEGFLRASTAQGLKGSIISLPYPSVGATENTILAAVTAKGTTIIKNASVDVEVVDLILFLQKLGANITLDTDRVITIQGTRLFYSAEHTIIPDRTEVVAFATLALATNGKIFVRGAEHDTLITFLNTVREVGGSFAVAPDGIEFFAERELKGGLHIETDVHPGFLTDWQPEIVVLLTQAAGSSILHETVLENRLGYVETLLSMGAEITALRQCLGGRVCRFNDHAHPHSLIIRGKTVLKPTSLTIPDLRASFAYLSAALVADGESSVSGVELLTHYHEHIFDRLRGLGADIYRVPQTASSEPDLLSLMVRK